MKNNMIKKFLYIIALLGLADATYLLVIKFTQNKSLCLPSIGDCWSVNNSVYSEWNGIPISVFGMLAYISIIALLFFSPRIQFLKNTGHIFIFGIALSGVIFSVYLTYLQIAVIKAICPFCIISALTMTTVFILSTIQLVRAQKELIAE